MDAIVERGGTKQWRPKEYDLHYERVITKIQDKTIFIDNPVVMSIEKQYGGGAIFQYRFTGRLSKVGIERLRFESFLIATPQKIMAGQPFNLTKLKTVGCNM